MRGIKNALNFLWGTIYGACLATIIIYALQGHLINGTVLIFPAVVVFFSTLFIILIVVFYLSDHWSEG